MPVNAFNGSHGWGYDGVLWSAVHEAYGGPAAYQRFVDACHARGLGVIQDVVHNHLGPSGNYLPLFGPYLVDGATPRGATRSTSTRPARHEVRRLHPRLGPRLVHRLPRRRAAARRRARAGRPSEPHLLEEMADRGRRAEAHLGKPLFLIAESDLNDPHVITPREAGGLGIDAQWSDDFHHALHVALTGETDGYYADFEPLGALAKVLERGFFHDGTWSSFRGRDHGRPLDPRTPGWRLVVANQNHDQVGNRARGDRLTEQLDDDQLAVAALLTLASPFTPMLFMGEEWGASTPFAFFTSHPEPRARAGRLRGPARASSSGWAGTPRACPTRRTRRPSSAPGSTGRSCESERGRTLLGVYRDLAELRRELPALTDPDLRAVEVDHDEDARWLTMRRGRGADTVVVAVDFADHPVEVPLPDGPGGVRRRLRHARRGTARRLGGRRPAPPPRWHRRPAAPRPRLTRHSCGSGIAPSRHSCRLSDPPSRHFLPLPDLRE